MAGLRSDAGATKAVRPRKGARGEVAGCVADLEVDWLEPFDQDEEEKRHEEECGRQGGGPGDGGRPTAEIEARGSEEPGKVRRGEAGARFLTKQDSIVKIVDIIFQL